MNLKTLETLVNSGLAAAPPKFGKSEVSFDLISKSRIFKKWFLKNLMGKEKFNAERKNNLGKLSRKKGKVKSDFSFNLGAGVLTFL